MIPVYNPGDCVNYNGRCYKIRARDHSLVGIGYNLVGLVDPVNQADLMPCDDELCLDQEETVDVVGEIVEEQKEYIQRVGRIRRISNPDFDLIPSIVVKQMESSNKPLPNLEIERKFLVNVEGFKKVAPSKSVHITQAYLSTNPGCVVRLRIAGDKAFLTIKGKTVGLARPEYEYSIPFDEASEMIRMGNPPTLSKTRHYAEYKGKTWEVDEFDGRHQGLWIAEVELAHVNDEFEKPDWITEEVTDDPRYTNAWLVQNK